MIDDGTIFHFFSYNIVLFEINPSMEFSYFRKYHWSYKVNFIS